MKAFDAIREAPGRAALRPAGLALFAAAAMLAGCAGAAATGAAARAPLEAPERFTVRYRADAPQTRTDLDIGMERTWEVLPAVFKDLGLPAAPSYRRDERVMMTPHLQVRGALYPGERTSDYLDCGQAAMAGQRADTDEVTFVIIIRLTPVGEGRTRMETMVDGVARDRQRADSVAPCSSTGKFEEQITARLLQKARPIGE